MRRYIIAFFLLLVSALVFSSCISGCGSKSSDSSEKRVSNSSEK